MRVYTVKTSNIEDGAKVEALELKNAGISIPTVQVGEKGRGREIGVVPVKLLPEAHRRFLAGEEVRLTNVNHALTKSGKPKFIQTEVDESPESTILVIRTSIGFRGDNAHKGLNGTPFPGTIISQGVIAQGDAGRMGSGKQLICEMPYDKPFEIQLGGRLYGAPDVYVCEISFDSVLGPIPKTEYELIEGEAT